MMGIIKIRGRPLVGVGTTTRGSPHSFARSFAHLARYLVSDGGLGVQPRAARLCVASGDRGRTVAATTAQGIAAIDLGEIHPATMTDGQEAVIVSCRKLRSDRQHGFKQLAKFQTAQAALMKKSRQWWRLQKRKNRFLAKQALRRRDSEHKISPAVVQWAVDHQIGTLVIGDVRPQPAENQQLVARETASLPKRQSRATRHHGQ